MVVIRIIASLLFGAFIILGLVSAILPDPSSTSHVESGYSYQYEPDIEDVCEDVVDEAVEEATDETVFEWSAALAAANESIETCNDQIITVLSAREYGGEDLTDALDNLYEVETVYEP